ncbi:hypothetical protein Tco_0082515, partial [Tanacetum coccineum]
MWFITSSSIHPWYAFTCNSFKNSLLSSMLISLLVKISAGFVLKKDRKNLARKSNRKTKIYVSVPDDRYAVSSGSGYAVLISLNEYAVLDRKFDTPYPMEVDTPYSVIDQN